MNDEQPLQLKNHIPVAQF